MLSPTIKASKARLSTPLLFNIKLESLARAVRQGEKKALDGKEIQKILKSPQNTIRITGSTV